MIWLDTEAWNETPIKFGTYRYTSTCEPMVVTYALNDGPVSCWDRTADSRMPDDLEWLLLDTEEEITAHFAMFDRNVLKYGLGLDIPIKRWRCMMVRALAHALPGGLDILGEITGVAQELRKLKAGKKLVKLFCMPQRFAFGHKKTGYPGGGKKWAEDKAAAEAKWDGRATRHTHPVEWAEFLEYATQDIPAMRALDKILPKWNSEGRELALYHLDQVICDRGFQVDVDLAQAAVAAVEEEKARLAARTVVVTNDEVSSTTKRDEFLSHLLREYGVDLPDMQKSTIERRLDDPSIPPELKELLAIRLQASSTSSSKYIALLNAVMPDGRLRGTLQFNGAGRTRRWAGRTFQPQNLFRAPPGLDVDAGIEALKGGYADVTFDNVMLLTAAAVRGCIIAPPGKKLVIADLANIEGRVAAWLAGEDWKLQAFREYDAGTGPDLYCLAYAKAFRISPESVTKAQRQIGKVMELMLQYGGGVGAFVTGAATYNIDLESMAEVAYPHIPAEIIRESTKFLKWAQENDGNTYGLSDKVFVVCDALKRMWRLTHPAISTLWPELERASVDAIENPGTVFTVRRFKVLREGAWLRVKLPSGRYLCYPFPRVERGTISYMGVNQYTRRWDRLTTYGGKTFEQTCQSGAGDVMKDNMPAIEEAGYEIVLSVHDELPTEAPDTDEYTAAGLSSLLATPVAWAPELPLAAAGFEASRYRKG